MQTINKKTWHGRFPSKDIRIGEVFLGSNYPVRLQSMTNTNTLDASSTVEQCLRIIEAGADFVRISTPNIKSAENLIEIKKQIRSAGFNTPIIADIHYNPDVAIKAARIAEKIRINPGNYCSDASFTKKAATSDTNYYKELEVIEQKISPLLSVCKEYGTAVRIGTNHGSLSPRILYKYGNTAEGMVQATLEYIQMFEGLGFYNTVISLKSSNPNVLIEAYRQMADALIKRKVRYPLHLGVTEAGAHEEGRVRSALGICSLLNDGIGDTIRVSLSEEPEEEIPFAKKIVQTFEKSFEVKAKNECQNTDTDKFENLKEIRDRLPQKPFEYPIVISTCCEKNIQQAKEKTPGSPPDFLFCSKLMKISNSKLILPYKLWKEQNNPEIFPILKINEIKNPGEIDSAFTFVLANTKDILKDELTNVFLLKNPLLILETSFDTTECELIDLLMTILASGSIPVILKSKTDLEYSDQLIIEASKLHGYAITEGIINGTWIEPHDSSNNDKTTMLSFSLLQAAGKRITTNQYISCPTCARTSFDLQTVLKDVKKHTQHFKGFKIAVMGCVVNGPGEMADADYGLVGTGTGKIHLYKKQQIIKKNIEQKNAAKELVELIKSFEKIMNKKKLI